MKRILCMAVAFLLMGGALAMAQSAGEDYTRALQKKGMDQVRAFEEYVKKYPDTSAAFTQYAHYWIAVGYYNAKSYGEAIAKAEKALSVGVPEKSNEAMLYLVLANAYGVKDSPKFSKDQASRYVDKAIETARAAEDGASVLRNAEALKKELAGSTPPPKKPVSNLDKMKLAYNQQKFGEALSLYDSLPDADKKNQDYLEVYALSLFQMKRFDQAIEKVGEAYNRNKRGLYASLLAQMYSEKAKKDKKLLDTAAEYYCLASLLYGKEGKADLKSTNLEFAKVQVGEKYDYNARAAKVNQSMKSMPKPVDNTKEIARLQREHDKMQRDLERKYEDQEPPDYETAKLDAILQKIDKLTKDQKPRPSDPKLQAEMDQLMKEQPKIDAELKTILENTRKKLGM